MNPRPRLSVTVRIAGDALDPTEITHLLGATPAFAARKGEQVGRRHRTVTQRSGIWTYRLPNEPPADWDLDDAIAALLASLPGDVAIWRSLGQRFDTDVFCGFFMQRDNHGVELRPNTLALLAERGLTLELDIYGPPTGDETP
jgi:hypothetical protein